MVSGFGFIPWQVREKEEGITTEVPFKASEPVTDWEHRLIPEHTGNTYSVGKVTQWFTERAHRNRQAAILVHQGGERVIPETQKGCQGDMKGT